MWKSLEKKRMVEIVRENDSRKSDLPMTSEVGEYKDETLFHYDLVVFDDDRKITVKPFILENFESVLYDSGNKKITAIAGIKNNKEIYSLGAIWEDDGSSKIRQYFFRNDKPSAFNYGYLSGPGWPLNMNAFMIENAREEFEELSDICPDVFDSLETCIELLSVPGPEFKEGDYSIKTKLYI